MIALIENPTAWAVGFFFSVFGSKLWPRKSV